MDHHRDAKRMAKALEEALRARDVALSHGQSLDIVARQLGLENWNVLSARIKRDEAADSRRMQALPAWHFLGEHPSEFDHGLDRDARQTGRRAALIGYRPSAPPRFRTVARVFGTLSQTVSAVPYHGKRLEIRAELATEGVSHGATIWARVDRAVGQPLGFDNLKHGPEGWLFGDTDWTRRRIVIDVVPEATTLQFGFFLKGTGSVWAGGFAVNAVPDSVPLTAEPVTRTTSEPGWITPTNLDFSDVVDLDP